MQESKVKVRKFISDLKFAYVYPTSLNRLLWQLPGAYTCIWLITKTHLYNFDPLKPHFYIVKLGFREVYIIFKSLLKNNDCGYSLEPPRRGGSNEYPQSMFWAEIWKYQSFLSENFQFLEEKFSRYLHRHVFVMWRKYLIWIVSVLIQRLTYMYSSMIQVQLSYYIFTKAICSSQWDELRCKWRALLLFFIFITVSDRCLTSAKGVGIIRARKTSSIPSNM